MATIRTNAIEDLLHRSPRYDRLTDGRISEYYAENVFTVERMREHLPEEAYHRLMAAMEGRERMDHRIADQVASSMKEWAISRGATHYTHWFQPLTGATAEKHDAFFRPAKGGGVIERFDGSLLVQQEPDASSFPSGGLRNTFEARGYTAWDPSSPAFVIGNTLCIPTIFISYTGEALDYKMPLLKALTHVDKAATRVCKFFDRNVSTVTATLGWEQEYFLVDKALYNARPDLMMTGRALIGHAPAKGQQLDDHYFGSIPERIVAFMREFEYEALRLGIPVTTRHNEVAPNQFECAPIFEEANLANDHNLLLMDIMEKVARKHDFRVLLHEKPFAGLNGSGKHNNWSLATDTGVNLLQPGKNPKSNLQFLTFFVNTIKAIHDHADVLRASIASAGNDHRLGANEAPPAIMSVFIGSQLTEVLDKLEKNVKAGKMNPKDKTELKLDIGKIPQLMLDNTDRNRTSPFAFTGNKFEFRAVGSSANCASAMIVINTIVAHQLNQFADTIEQRIKKGEKKDEAILKELQKLIKSSKAIRFEGNGYGEEWVKEAAKRGLSNHRDTPRAMRVLQDAESMKVFRDAAIFTEHEIDARLEIELENYIRKIQIEARVLGDIANNHILPTALKYQSRLLQNIEGMISVFGEKEGKKLAAGQIDQVKEIANHMDAIRSGVRAMIEERKKANGADSFFKMAELYCDKVRPYFDSIREATDKLEMMIDDDLWALPKLREILFTR